MWESMCVLKVYRPCLLSQKASIVGLLYAVLGGEHVRFPCSKACLPVDWLTSPGSSLTLNHATYNT